MRTPGLRNARDYNRGLAWPVRVWHVLWGGVWAVVGAPVRDLYAWVMDPARRSWALPVAVAALLFPVFYRLDPAITAWATSVQVGGDVRREFLAIQQYGQGLSIIIVGLVIWLQDPARRRRLADWGAAMVVAFGVVQVGKLLVGRPRPKYDDPYMFLGPLGQYPVDRVMDGEAVGIRHAWEFWAGISSDLASMPSSHTVYAVLMSVVLGTLYPRLRWVVYPLAGLVALGRVMTNAHWASDVLVGAAIGLAVGRTAMERCWGQRVLWGREAERARAAGAGPSAGPEDRAPGHLDGDARGGGRGELAAAASSGGERD